MKNKIKEVFAKIKASFQQLSKADYLAIGAIVVITWLVTLFLS